MPKINYIKDEWAIPKNCGACGKIFYPIGNEDFCDYRCRSQWDDYVEWYDWKLVEDMLRDERTI